jgi:hypothetical protein
MKMLNYILAIICSSGGSLIGSFMPEFYSYVLFRYIIFSYQFIFVLYIIIVKGIFSILTKFAQMYLISFDRSEVVTPYGACSWAFKISFLCRIFHFFVAA